MKKATIIIITLVLAVQLNAQDAFSPAGNITIDLNFNPAALFDANAGSMFAMPYIMGRFFLDSRSAFRLGLLVEFDNDKEYLDVDGDNSLKSSSTLIALAPGYEKQYGTNRFYVYVGGELPITSYSTKQTADIDGNITKGKNIDGGFFSIMF